MYKATETEYLLIDSINVGTYVSRALQAHVRRGTLYITYKKEWAVNDTSLEEIKVYRIHLPSGEKVTSISIKCDSVA